MTTVRRILCPTDFSRSARRAFDEALALARWYRGELLLLHCDHSAPLVDPSGITGAHLTCVTPAECERALQPYFNLARDAGVPCRVVSRSRQAAATAIVEVARDLVADLIVMGTHGLTGLDRLLLGSVAEAVLHAAPCPVLSVSDTVDRPPTAVFSRILCAVDFSAGSRETVAQAIALSAEAAARLTLLHVVESVADAPVAASPRAVLDAYDDAMRNASERLESMVPADVRSWCDVATRVVAGRPAERIVSEARADETDLVVIGAHAHEGLAARVFGSTAQRIVRRAPCAVFTVRHDDSVRRQVMSRWATPA